VLEKKLVHSKRKISISLSFKTWSCSFKYH